MTLYQRKIIPKWRIIVLICLYVIILGVLGNLLISPPVSKFKVDCKKAMAAWNYDLGQAGIASLSGQDKKATALKNDYENLVLKFAPSCFPAGLKDYLIQNS
jgi:hypothetical protein